MVNGLKFRAVWSLCQHTPAAQWLAGFKEGVSFATRPCRHCNVQYNDMKKHTNARSLAMRTVEEHTQRCDAIEDQNLTKTAKKYWSKTLGINSRSPLSPIKHFGLTKCLVQDPVHLMLEGIVPYEMALFLNNAICTRSIFSRTWLNNKIASYPYSYLEKTKPEPLQKHHLLIDVKVKQTSAAMLVLCSTLPFILGQFIPDGDAPWQCLLTLLQILYICVSPIVSLDTATELEHLIAQHHNKFMTPKVHAIWSLTLFLYFNQMEKI